MTDRPATHPAQRTGSAHGLWAVLGAVATVVLEPAAATASALGRADAAPPHHAAKAGRTRAHPPSRTSRRPAAGTDQPRKRSHSRG
ncbi:hypothetical protein [Streptomyces sp. NPDC058735]|uniref:hypothetical protein n=1 Tax=unclassified Streptomyces TaxID=2593676 RepID=UPI003681B42D